MLTHKARKEEITEWKRTFDFYKDRLFPNRKSGGELVRYLCERYPVRPVFEEKALSVVTENVLGNDFLKEKLQGDAQPRPAAFFVERSGTGADLYKKRERAFRKSKEIFVGIELETGYFCVEGSGELYDELVAFRGVDDKDLENFYLVAEYVSNAQKFGVPLPLKKS